MYQMGVSPVKGWLFSIRWLQILKQVHRFEGKNTEIEISAMHFDGMDFVGVGILGNVIHLFLLGLNTSHPLGSQTN